jgi:hypothetical protein
MATGVLWLHRLNVLHFGREIMVIRLAISFAKRGSQNAIYTRLFLAIARQNGLALLRIAFEAFNNLR